MMQSRTLCYCQHTAGDRRRCYNEPTTTTRRRGIELNWNSTDYCLFCIWIWMRIENWGLGIHTCVVSCLVLLLCVRNPRIKGGSFSSCCGGGGMGWDGHTWHSHMYSPTNKEATNAREEQPMGPPWIIYFFSQFPMQRTAVVPVNDRRWIMDDYTRKKKQVVVCLVVSCHWISINHHHIFRNINTKYVAAWRGSGDGGDGGPRVEITNEPMINSIESDDDTNQHHRRLMICFQQSSWSVCLLFADN